MIVLYIECCLDYPLPTMLGSVKQKLCLFSLSIRKYRKLEVRYTRLRQGPMRFTFTAEGETLEEEDYPNSDEESDNGDDDDDDGEENTYKMSDKSN